MKLIQKVSNFASAGMSAVLAQTSVPDVTQTPVPIFRATTLTQLFTTSVRWLLIIAAVVAVLYLIYGGFLYLTAGGDAERVTKAKTTIINAVIGVVVISLAFAIYFAIANFLDTQR